MTTDQLEFRRPTPADYRAIRYAIHRNRGESVADANAAADLELECWLAQQDQANAAELLLAVAA